VWRIDGSWESQTYRADSSGPLAAAATEESRAHGALTVSDWLSAGMRFSLTTGIDSWSGVAGRTIFAGGSLERRWSGDRWIVAGNAMTWIPSTGVAAFQDAGLHARFRSSASPENWVYLADGGIERVSDHAPFALWHGAGDGHARDPLLRAHPMLDHGAIDLDRTVFGRTLTHAHGEVQRWIDARIPVRFGVAAFGDLARASRRDVTAVGSILQTDVGSGLRVRIPGASGTLRVDIAHGLRDGADALTLGWQF
jgi:hypothetical protein